MLKPRFGVDLRLILSVAGPVLLVVGLVDAVNFTVDDTFIFLRYAENLVNGKGLVFNPGERVEGISSVPWTLLIALLGRAGFLQDSPGLSPLLVAKLAGAALGLATMVLLAWFSVRVSRGQGWGDYALLPALAAPCAAATYSIPAWSISGMETPLCAFLVTLAIVLVMEGLRRFDLTGRAPRALILTAGVVFGVLSLVRPEQVFIWAVSWAILVWTSPGALRRPLLISAAATAAIYLASMGLRLAYYGAPLPNSVVAKMGGGIAAWILGAKYALTGLGMSVGFVAIGFLGLSWLVRQGTAWRFLALYCLAYVGFIVFSGGDWMPGSRLHVPVMPVLWVLGLAGLASLFSASRLPVGAYRLSALLLCLAAASFAAGRSSFRSQMTFPSGFRTITWHVSPERVRLARELRRIVPPGSLIAMFEAGYIPYFNPQLRVLDTSGLMDRAIARMPGRHMFKMKPEYFLERAPDYYLTMVRDGRPSADAITLLNSPEFRSRYEPFWDYDSRRVGVGLASTGPAQPEEEDQVFLLYRRRS